MTKHQPATPLPWRWKIGAEGGCALHSGPSDGKQELVLLTVARRGSLSIAPKRGDTDYVAHAANAYPKLVEALRGTLRALEHIDSDQFDSEAEREPTADKMVLTARSAYASYSALLRELGEEA